MRIRHLAVALALSSSVLIAQSFTPVREQKNLSPAAAEKLQMLETLNMLPGGDWRFHAGDVPHGETPSLDDSAWQLIPRPKPRESVKASKQAVWYRRTVTVPYAYNGYDLTGARIWFQFLADANGPMPEIVYFNGRRVALGDDLEPIVLFDHAKSGEKILIAVKLLQTVDDKSYRGVRMRIEPDRDSTRPNPEDVRVQAITAANLLPALPTPRPDLLPRVEEAVAAIDLKALTDANQAAFAERNSPDSTFTPAVLAKIAAANKTFDASLIKAQSILAPLHAVLAQDKVDLVGNAHIDAAWLWPRSETIDVVKRTFTTALQLMNEYPDYTYSQSAAQYTEWMADKYPELNKQIAARVKEGRWEIVGGMWVEPDLNLPGGESLVRQLLVGQRYFKQQYGVTARIGWNPDSFGYNWQLPQIYKRSGMDYFVTQKMHWNDTNTLPFRLFWWQSPDGSKVLTYFPTDYVHDNVSPTRISADFAESVQRNPGTTEHLDLYGIGDHGGGPTRDMLDQADHWIAMSTPTSDTRHPERSAQREAEGTRGSTALHGSSDLSSTNAAAIPTMRYGTAQHYFTDVESHLNPNSSTWNYDSIAKGYTAPPAGADGSVGIPTWNSELYFEYHRGIMTTQAKHKEGMRRSETETLNAEELASLAWLNGDKYPNDLLTDNWKKITFNQFHDLAAGSGIAIIYRDAADDYAQVYNNDNSIDDASLKTVSSNIDTSSKSGVPVMIFNTMAWPRSEVVQFDVQLADAATGVMLLDSKGQRIPAQTMPTTGRSGQFTIMALVPNVPALGYAVIHVAPADKAAPLNPELKSESSAASFTLSNAHLKVIVDRKTGCITSLTAVPAGTSYFAPNSCGNQLQTYKDTPKQYDAWNVDPGTFDVPSTPIDQVDSVTILTDSPLRKTIQIHRTWQSSHFTQNISLDAGADVVRVSNDVDWHETHVLLKAAFPLAASGPKATYEIPYGAIERPTTHNNSWEKAQFEVPAQRWADLGDDKQGVSILNDSKYGYDALGNVLRLTLLRSPTWPDPEADRGAQHFVYEIYPHTGTWQHAETVHRGYELNTPLTAQQVFAHTGTMPATHSFASVAEPNVILSAIKKAEDTNALIFRVYEAVGQGTTAHLHIPPGATSVTEVNLMEAPIPYAAILTLTPNSEGQDTVTLPIKPWEIRTLQATYPQK